MSNRVLLDPNGLKVSAPGANVLTDTGANILFDSDFANAAVALRGSFTVPNNDYGLVLPVPTNFPNDRWPFILIYGHDSSRGYTFTAGGIGGGGIIHNSLGTAEVWRIYYGIGSSGPIMDFYQGTDIWEGPQGVTPPRAGPQVFPYTCHYIVMDFLS